MSEPLREQIARALESLECWCGHRKNQHDPEDGRCEAGVQLSNCPCLGFHTPDPDRTTAEYQADAVLPLVEAEIERVARFGERTQDELLARLAEVRRERDDLETSLAVVAEGFERARARVAKLKAALRALRALMEHPYYASREALDQWMSLIDAALDVAMSMSNAHPDSDQPPVPERTTGAPGGES